MRIEARGQVGTHFRQEGDLDVELVPGIPRFLGRAIPDTREDSTPVCRHGGDGSDMKHPHNRSYIRSRSCSQMSEQRVRAEGIKPQTFFWPLALGTTPDDAQGRLLL